MEIFIILVKNDLITLLPGYFMEILDFSPDIHIYYAGFSAGFIEGINLMKSTEHLLPVIMENPIITLSPLQAFVATRCFMNRQYCHMLHLVHRQIKKR